MSNILRPQLQSVDFHPLRLTHQRHFTFASARFPTQGAQINELSRQIGADAVIRAGTFTDAMLSALDRVSASQQFASDLNQAALVDPDSVNVEDVTIAQARAMLSLNLTQNVLNRMVQGWRELINTR